MISISKRSYCKCRKLIYNQFTFKSFSTTPVTNNNNSDEEIVVDTKPNGVYTLSFNNEKKLNPMTVAMGEAFEEKMMELSTDKNMRCLVLTGKGKAFSAGGDLDFLRARTQDTPYNNSKIMRAFYRRFLSLRNFERFKNNLSWQLITKTYIKRPVDLYNNRYEISILRTNGIYYRTIYANRSKEIEFLSNSSLLTIVFLVLMIKH